MRGARHAPGPHGHALPAAPSNTIPPNSQSPGQDVPPRAKTPPLPWARDAEPGDSGRPPRRGSVTAATGVRSRPQDAAGGGLRSPRITLSFHACGPHLVTMTFIFWGRLSYFRPRATRRRPEGLLSLAFGVRGGNGRAPTRRLSGPEICPGRSGRRATDVSEADGDPRPLSPHPRRPETGTRVPCTATSRRRPLRQQMGGPNVSRESAASPPMPGPAWRAQACPPHGPTPRPAWAASPSQPGQLCGLPQGTPSHPALGGPARTPSTRSLCPARGPRETASSDPAMAAGLWPPWAPEDRRGREKSPPPAAPPRSPSVYTAAHARSFQK